jgi:anthranilate phosphoribosyltransferase
MSEVPALIDAAPLLNDLFEGQTLSRERAKTVMLQLMEGKIGEVQATALLASLRTRGETVEEITGFAEAMREKAVKVPMDLDEPLFDACGTGGTGVTTVNISTTSLFVVAAAGLKVAKHGNRTATRGSGSADVLEALGVTLEQSPKRLAASIREVGMAFLYARSHHPAMKFVAPIRAQLRARTVFNVLGPLTNPAGADRQLLGVYRLDLTHTLAEVLRGLGTRRALVVYGAGIDELSVCGENIVSELDADGQVRNYALCPDDVGLKLYPLADLYGDGPEKNAEVLKATLRGEVEGAKRDVVLLNAGAALYLGERAESIAEGVTLAREVLGSGAAYRKLEEFVAFSRG